MGELNRRREIMKQARNWQYQEVVVTSFKRRDFPKVWQLEAPHAHRNESGSFCLRLGPQTRSCYI